MNKSEDSKSLKLFFTNSPIPQWEIDYSLSFLYFKSLKEKGVLSLISYLKEHPEAFYECLNTIRIEHINTKVLELFEVESKKALIQGNKKFFTKRSRETFIEQMDCFFRGEKSFSAHSELITENKTIKYIRLQSNLFFRGDQVLGSVSTEDISLFKIQEKQFEKMIALSPDSITINRLSDGKFTFINKVFREGSGFSDAELKNKSAYELNMWVNESERDLYFKALKENGFVENLPASFREKGGNIREALVSAKIVDYMGEPQIIVNSKDVTALNKSNHALMQSEEQFRKAFMNIPDAFQINKVSDSTFVDVNEVFLNHTGYTREELIGKTPDELNIWASDKNSRSFYLQLKKHGELSNRESVFRMKNGELLQTLISATIIELNHEAHILTVTKDITTIKKAQDNLIQSEELFRSVFYTNPDPVHLIDLDSDTFVDVNDSFIQFTGYTRQEIIGKKPEELHLWANLEDKKRINQLMLKNGRVDNFQANFRVKNKQILAGLLSTRRLKLNGKNHFLSVIKDITTIKQTQDALEKSERKFQSIFSNSPDALAIMEMKNWTYVDVNEKFTQISGYSRESLLGKSTQEMNLWTRQKDRTFITSKAIRQEEINNYESLFTLKNGEKVHMLVSAKIIEIGQEKFYLLIAKDIEDFVKIKHQLFERDNTYKTIVSNSYEGICIVDDAFQFEYANHQLEIITGYSKKELIGEDFRQILSPESAIFVGKRYQERQAGKKIPQHYNFEVIRKSGETRIVEIHSSILKTADGNTKTIAQILDITDRSKANKLIEKEHKRAMQYFEVAGMMMVALDQFGKVTAVNHKGCEVLERSREDILGRDWFSHFIAQKEVKKNRELFFLSMKDEKFHDNYFESTIKTFSGKEKKISWRNSLLKDEENNIIGTISSGEDISEKEEANRILNLSGMVAILWKNDTDWPIEFVSENAEKLFGYRAEDFYFNRINYSKIVHPDDLDRVNEEVKRFAFEKRKNYSHQAYRIITKDGKTKWINDRTTVHYNSEGQITHYYGVLSDITEDIQKGEMLHQSNEILSQMNDGVIVINFGGKITSWSGNAFQIFGYKSSEILGQDISALWSSEINMEDHLYSILSEIEIFGFYQKEISCKHKNGRAIPIELTAKILYDSQENPLSLVLVNRDITNRKEAQKALQNSEKRYRNIFESILDGVIIYNMKREIVEVNNMAIKMYGYSYTEFKQTINARYIHPVQNHSFEEVVNHLNSNYDRMFEGESVDRRKNGEQFFVNVKGRLIDYNNAPHLLIIVRDITSIKQSEQDLLLAKEKAVESEKLKSAFLANMSHEIRTPMNSIIGFSDLLDDEDVSQEEKGHFLKIIRKNGSQLLNIINDIIDVSKIEAGQVKLNFENINLVELFMDLYQMFEPVAAEKNIELINAAANRSEAFSIETDEVRLKQILINLINNAMKFTHEGSIEFGFKLTDQEKSIHFYVKDTGIGISKEKQNDIFQRFMQAELKTTKLYGGTGLGLAISLGLVQTFKGKMWLESEVGKGSTFNFRLPY
jgi:PAS domain S-box-containing protein